ncbi:MAG: hypothetical protein IPH88_07660 [Bacteroidales bacterium]|nr:hypothetical protein [Bacteroidales bacterium]
MKTPVQLLNTLLFRKLSSAALSIMMAGMLSHSTKAENIVTSGTTMKVVAGTSIVSSENFVLKNGATLDNSGTVILKKNLVNENIAGSALGSGTVDFSGTAAQTISGKSTFQNLTVNNASGVVNGGDNKVNGVLTLTSGLLTLGSNNLTMGSAASVAGTPSATAMVVPTSTGQLRKSYGGTGSFTFPIGDNTVTAEYSPVTLTFTAGTFGANNYVGASLVNAMYPGTPGGSYIKRYWDLTSSGITSPLFNTTFQYVPADVVGTESSIFTVRILPVSVVYYNVANTATHQLTASGLTTLGTFTGYQVLANKTLNVTCFIQGLVNGSGTMRKAQNDVGNQFPGSVADKITLELHNSGAYASIPYLVSSVDLNTNGTATTTIPGLFSSSYYVTVKHRNSIETTSAAPVSFAGATINYNYSSAAANAYGNNMKIVSGGFWAFYTGDVNQDGIIDSGDMIPVENQSNNFATGYISEDTNGDGLIDSSDMIIVENNSNDFISAITP